MNPLIASEEPAQFCWPLYQARYEHATQIPLAARAVDHAIAKRDGG